MGYFKLEDFLFSFILVFLYSIILYLIIKQSIRLITFGNVIVYIKEKVFNKHIIIYMGFYLVLAIVYLVFTFREGKLDVYYANMYGYFDTVKYRLFLKWALNLLPFFIGILVAVCSSTKERLSTKGIIGDKLAFKWDEIKTIEIDNNKLRINYNYRIILLNFSFIYVIYDINDNVIRLINTYSNNKINNS